MSSDQLAPSTPKTRPSSRLHLPQLHCEFSAVEVGDFRVYAKVLAQNQERANDRIDQAMREWNEPE